MEKYLRILLGDEGFNDVSTKRSRAMSKIRGRHNRSTELLFQMMLVRSGTSGWKTNISSIIGKPDFFFEKYKVAVFIDGCFWHGCPICGHVPKTRSEFWRAKIEKNKQRDLSVEEVLMAQGIKVVRFWEHELANPNVLNKLIDLFINKG